LAQRVKTWMPTIVGMTGCERRPVNLKQWRTDFRYQPPMAAVL